MTNVQKTTGALLVIVPIVFGAGFSGLQAVFDYPHVLRLPAGEVLTRFAAGAVDLHLYWYAMFAAALLMIPAAIGMGMSFAKADRFVAALSIGFGVLAGLVQALGLMRWTFLVPSLADAYTAAGATDADKAIAVAIFDATNRYLGMGVGEHMGYFFTALWTLTVALMIWKQWRIVALVGIVVAAGVIVGMAEPFGVPLAGIINAIAYSVWILWALVLGMALLWKGDRGMVAGMVAA